MEVGMRVLAGHDVEGNIQYVMVSPADAPPATVTTETGLLVTEVEAPEVIAGLDLSDPKDTQQLGKVLHDLQDFRVEVGKAKLVRKKSKPKAR